MAGTLGEQLRNRANARTTRTDILRQRDELRNQRANQLQKVESVRKSLSGLSFQDYKNRYNQLPYEMQQYFKSPNEITETEYSKLDNQITSYQESIAHKEEEINKLKEKYNSWDSKRRSRSGDDLFEDIKRKQDYIREYKYKIQQLQKNRGKIEQGISADIISGYASDYATAKLQSIEKGRAVKTEIARQEAMGYSPVYSSGKLKGFQIKDLNKIKTQGFTGILTHYKVYDGKDVPMSDTVIYKGTVIARVPSPSTLTSTPVPSYNIFGGRFLDVKTSEKEIYLSPTEYKIKTIPPEIINPKYSPVLTEQEIKDENVKATIDLINHTFTKDDKNREPTDEEKKKLIYQITGEIPPKDEKGYQAGLRGISYLGTSISGLFGYGVYTTEAGESYGGRAELYDGKWYEKAILPLYTLKETWKMRKSATEQKREMERRAEATRQFTEEYNKLQKDFENKYRYKITKDTNTFIGTEQEYLDFKREYDVIKSFSSAGYEKLADLGVKQTTQKGETFFTYGDAPEPLYREVGEKGTGWEKAGALTTIAVGKGAEAYFLAKGVTSLIPPQATITAKSDLLMKRVGVTLGGVYLGGQGFKAYNEYQRSGIFGAGVVGVETLGTATGFTLATGSFPVKYRKFGGNEALGVEPSWKGLTLKYGKNEVGLIGKTYGYEKTGITTDYLYKGGVLSYGTRTGTLKITPYTKIYSKLTFGNPKVIPYRYGQFQGYIPQSQYELNLYKKFIAPYQTQSEQELLSNVMKVRTSTYKVGLKEPLKPATKNEIISTFKRAGVSDKGSEEVYKYLYGSKSQHFIYGSTPTKAYLQSSFSREPHDVDIMNVTNYGEKSPKVIKKILKVYSPKTKVVIDEGQLSIKGGSKLLDIHWQGMEEAGVSPEKILGFKYLKAVKSQEGINIMSLSQSATQKAGAITTLQDRPVYWVSNYGRVSSKLTAEQIQKLPFRVSPTFSPEPFDSPKYVANLKSVKDYYEIEKFLLEKSSQSTVTLEQFKKSAEGVYGKNIFDIQTKPSLIISNAPKFRSSVPVTLFGSSSPVNLKVIKSPSMNFKTGFGNPIWDLKVKVKQKIDFASNVPPSKSTGYEFLSRMESLSNRIKSLSSYKSPSISNYGSVSSPPSSPPPSKSPSDISKSPSARSPYRSPSLSPSLSPSISPSLSPSISQYNRSPSIPSFDGLFGGGIGGRARTYRVKQSIKALFPDFTSRALGLKPRKVKNVGEALREINKIQTGFELRTGARFSMNEKSILKGIAN